VYKRQANGFTAWNFEVGVAFQPDWDEAFAEAMEFSNGLMELFEVAHDFDKDNLVPQSDLIDPEDKPAWNRTFQGQADLRFSTSEPATIYYTTDGSRPTYASPIYSSNGLREPGAVLSFFTNTVVNWFAVDAAGNVSKNYNPAEPNKKQYYSTEVRIK
jgi:hypothetical protein